jgi:hypothetical protein
MTADFATAIAQVTLEGRELAESLMQDTCVVEYVTGATTKDPYTDREIPVYATRFISKCKVQVVGTLSSEQAKVGEEISVIGTARIDLPVATPQVAQNDRITITAVGPLSDVRLVGRSFLVGSPMNKTYATATRLTVKEAL